MNKKTIDFFIVGTAKAATTSIYKYLDRYKSVYFPSNKEPHFFLSPEGTIQYYGTGDMRSIENLYVLNSKSYFALYKDATNKQLKGDASVTYLYSSEAAKNIYKHNPAAKIIVVLRNPVDRAFSAYTHLKRDFREDAPNFLEALNREPERIQKNWMPIWHYTNMSLYYLQVKRYYDIFPIENIFVCFYEDFVSNPSFFFQQLLDFLKIKYDLEYTGETYNQGGLPKYVFIQKFLKQDNVIKHGVKKSLLKITNPDNVRNLRKQINRYVDSFNLVKNDELSDKTRLVIFERFEKDIKLLESLLRRELDILRY